MKTDILSVASALSDADLLSRLSILAARSREDTVEMVAHLAELEARRIYLAEGYGSAFVYCRVALCLSEHAAYSRLVAARVARQFPVVLEGLADGSFNLTTLRLLAPHLTPNNHRDVLARAVGRSKREIEALVASLAPQPDVAPSVRKLPASEAVVSPEGSALATSVTRPTPTVQLLVERNAASGDPTVTVPAVPAGPPPAPRPVIASLSPTRYRLQCTIGEQAHANLRLAQDLLRREIPDGDPGAIVERALTLLLAHIAKEKTAATPTPGPPRPTAAGSRHIPAAVKRAVWLRDRGQCAFMARIGRRCTERAFLEFHHIRPFAVGGEATVGNISLRCRRHNVHEAELVFGERRELVPERVGAASGVDIRRDDRGQMRVRDA
jgi:5-methylcytosine-specific restriction endonuclease McrA